MPRIAQAVASGFPHHVVQRGNNREKVFIQDDAGYTLCYTQYINRTYKRTGRLWESRYHSCVVDKEKYLWAVARYIVSERKRTFWKSARTIFSLPIDNFRIRDQVFATNKVFSHII